MLPRIMKDRLAQAHRRLFKMVEPLTEEQWRWRATPAAHNIAFQVWHMSRYADLFQSEVPGMTSELGRRLGARRQLWHAEELATQWGLNPADLGWEEIGSGMDDAVAASLPLPRKDVLLDYARRVLAALEQAVGAVEDEEFEATGTGHAGAQVIGWYILDALGHAEWDIGSIASLRRAQGVPRAEA